MHKTTIKTIFLSLALAALFGCSSGNNGAGSAPVDASGKHPANWLQQHWVAYRQANGGSSDVSSTTACSECHGSDLSGGISQVSCFSASINGVSCHANADHTLGHPALWADPTSSDFHGGAVRGASAAAITASCGLCHAIDSDVTIVGTAPSCLSKDPQFGISCHATSPAAKSAGCVSCHSTPPTGGAFPNISGAHAVHLGLAGVTCGSCHSGLGSGTDRHATAAFLNHSTAYLKLGPGYPAKTGSFSYVGGKCAGVSCHGGKQTPAWRGGVPIDPSTDCLKCHEQGTAAQTPQFNSFFSGNILGGNEHLSHLSFVNPNGNGALIICTDCHRMTPTSHFQGLATPAFETPAAGTVQGNEIVSYDTVNGCNNKCHPVVGIPNFLHWNQ